MDLENRLLEELSLYQKSFGSWARVRQAIHNTTLGRDYDVLRLLDEACTRYVYDLTADLLPDEPDEARDDAILATMPQRKEVAAYLIDKGYGEQLITGNGLVAALLGWAAVQGYGHWGNIPWKRLVETLLDQEWANAN